MSNVSVRILLVSWLIGVLSYKDGHDQALPEDSPRAEAYSDIQTRLPFAHQDSIADYSAPALLLLHRLHIILWMGKAGWL